MSTIQRVLFPIDLSSDYRALSPATRKLLDRPDVEIVMLHVLEEASRSLRGMDAVRAMAQLEFLARREFERAQCSWQVQRGRAAQSILDYARKREADMIVMLAGGPENLSRGSLGSVTEQVLRDAPCAVWTEWIGGAAESVRHICCAVSLDGTDEAVVSGAAEIARKLHAELTILHAVVPDSPMVLWWDADELEREVRTARSRVNELREKFAPDTRLHVETGRLDAVIGRALRLLHADLLIVAGQGEALSAAANACPVLRIAAMRPKLAKTSTLHFDNAQAATA